MSSIDEAPHAVRQWLGAHGDPARAEQIRRLLGEEVEFVFAGQVIRGVDAVMARLAAMPAGRLGSVEWNLLPDGDEHEVTVRGTGPDGTPLPSPGGPLSALDFWFRLDDAGLITGISPRPHHTEPTDLRPPLQPGQPAPDFILPDVQGGMVPLAHSGATATVVVFTCNPCPWAKRWHGRIQAVARDWADRGVRVLQINANDPQVSPGDSLEESRRRAAAGEFAGPFLVDERQVVARAWGARHTPEVFVIDRRGTVAYHGAPDADVDDETLAAGWVRAALESVISNSTPDPANTPPVGCTVKWTL